MVCCACAAPDVSPLNCRMAAAAAYFSSAELLSWRTHDSLAPSPAAHPAPILHVAANFGLPFGSERIGLT